MPEAEQDSIYYYNRYTQSLEKERVYGEGWLRWVYNHPFGRFLLWAAVKRSLFSKWYGWRMNLKGSRSKVASFIEKYGVDVSEFLEEPNVYQTFNEFFYRKLKPQARPIDSSKESVVFPADGRHLGFQNISEVDSIFVKGQKFNLLQLLGGDHALAERFKEGSLVLSRLCPVDYHRFHFPTSGTPSQAKCINGPLYSVNPIALRKKVEILFENKRELTVLKTDTLGDVLLIEVGATCVGTIGQTYSPETPIQKGDEKGYFAFGGSSTITIFEPGRIKLSEDLVTQTAQGHELYAKMGDIMGKCS